MVKDEKKKKGIHSSSHDYVRYDQVTKPQSYRLTESAEDEL